ncbi:MAG: hypothetical protein ACW99G_22380 [Candidatus Thorarchaeota archaeon]
MVTKKMIGIAVTAALGISIMINTDTGAGIVFFNKSAGHQTTLFSQRYNTCTKYNSKGQSANHTAKKCLADWNEANKDMTTDERASAVASIISPVPPAKKAEEKEL